ncbi:MAG: hypothetical protein ACD_75C02154G0002 [uncultured bacterium]|nr:MAG: hypothetical protein ACD_75C02154G0002 [uncultured bacterium]
MGYDAPRGIEHRYVLQIKFPALIQFPHVVVDQTAFLNQAELFINKLVDDEGTDRPGQHQPLLFAGRKKRRAGLGSGQKANDSGQQQDGEKGHNDEFLLQGQLHISLPLRT